jgi:cellobiose-specific phosphotransferase system component IIA
MTSSVDSAVKRNRSLVADTAWVLRVAETLKGGHLIVEPFTARDSHNKRVQRVRAVLMHAEDGVAVCGIGKSATEAVSELREALEQAASRHARRAKAPTTTEPRQ